MAETPDVDLQIVTLVLDTADPGALAGVLSRYVVLSRAEPGCRNIDLAVSATVPGRFVVVEKWETPTARRSHLDGETMVAMAEACRGLLTRPPAIDLLEPISAHDLR